MSAAKERPYFTPGAYHGGTAFQRQAAQRKADIGVAQTKAGYESDIGTAKGKAAGDIAKGVALGGASLLTGGLAAPAAMGLMGAAGVGAATLDETLRAHFGSEDIPKSGWALAKKLGLEGTLSAAGEGGARAVGQGLKYLGKEMMPGLIMRSAAKAQEGQNVLKRVQQNSLDQLRDFVRVKGNPVVDLGADLKQFFTTLGKRATGESSAFDAAMKPVYQKLGKAGQGVLDKQPLDALMEIKSDLSHVTYKVPGMNTDEFKALEGLTNAVDSKIMSHLERLGGSAATKVYRNYKAFTEQVKMDSAAMDLADSGIKKLLGKASGYVPGVDAAIDGVIREHTSPWLLERLFSNEKTASLVKKAIALQAVGKRGAAQAAFDTAVNTSDVGSLVKDWFKPEKRKAIPGVMQEAAANLSPQSQMGP